MTPLETAARAAWNEGREGKNPWEDLPQIIREGKIKQQAAALLALTQMSNEDLPDVSAGAAQFSPFPDAFASARKESFKRILNNIILERG